MTPKAHLRWLWLLLLGVLPVAFAVELNVTIEPSNWAWLNDTRLAPLLFLITYILAQQLFVSSVAFCVAGGLLFGPILGTLLSLSGATLGAALSFLMSRHLLAGWVTPHLSPTMLKIRQEVEEEGWRAVLFIRLLPILPFTPLNYTLGLTRITLVQFMLPTFVCIAPRIAVYVYLGHAGRRAMEGNLGVIWNVIVALGVLVAVSWLPHMIHRWRSR